MLLHECMSGTSDLELNLKMILVHMIATINTNDNSIHVCLFIIIMTRDSHHI